MSELSIIIIIGFFAISYLIYTAFFKQKKKASCSCNNSCSGCNGKNNC